MGLSSLLTAVSTLCTLLHSTCKWKSGSHPGSCNISGCKLLFFFDSSECVCVTTGALLCVKVEKYQTVRVCAVWVGVSLNVGVYFSDNISPLPEKHGPNREPCLLACRRRVGCTPAFSWLGAGDQLAGSGAPQRIAPVLQTKGKASVVI